MSKKVPDKIFCQNCQEVVVVIEEGGLTCADCGELICVKCGCTESEPCAEGCGWAKNGVCTECV